MHLHTARMVRARRRPTSLLGAAAIAALLMAGATASVPAGATALSGSAGQTLTTNPGTHLRPGVTPKVHTGPLPHAATRAPHLTYYGGPVVSHLKSVDVLYGTGSFAPNIGSFVAQFTTQYLGSGVIDWLHEYNTPSSGGTGQTIGRGTYTGTYSITPAPGDTGAVIQDTQVQAELAAQITAGHLPAPDANTSYALFFPHGEQICMGTTCSGVAGGFCAYHGTLTVNGVTTTYQVMPDNQVGSGLDTGCGSGTLQQNETSTLSRELVETITDPDVGFATVLGPPLGWYDATYGEIGDICNGAHATFVGSDAVTYTSQQQWSDTAAACILAPSAAPSITSPASVVVAVGASLTFSVTTAGFPIPTVTESGALPSGITFSARSLSGSSVAPGAYPISFTAHNSAGPDATQSFTLTVSPPTPATVSITNLPAGAYLGGGFTPTVVTSGDGATSVISSSPAVCTVSSGVVSDVGLGTCALVAHATATANFAAATGATQTYQVDGFTITTSSLPGATRGVPYGPVTLTEAGAGVSVSPNVTTVKWGKVTLPKGLKVSATGVLSGTPSTKLAAGPSSVTVKVTETTFSGSRKIKTKTTIQATIPLIVA